MLRISRKGKKTRFLYRCKRKDAMVQIKMHLKLWSVGRRKVSDKPKKFELYTVPPSDFIAEWVTHDGDNEVIELIPIPGS